MSDAIDGVPNGWKLVGFRQPKRGEFVIDATGKPYRIAHCDVTDVYPVICEIDEQKISRPDSRWKAELLGLYRSAESCKVDIPDADNVEYQSGVMTACIAIYHRVTGETLVQ